MVSGATVEMRGDGRDEVRVLHGRAVDGDRSAVDQLAAQFLPVLQQRLQRVFPRAASDLIADAVEDALLEYAGRPYRFDPTRCVPLEQYLLTASSRNLINSLDSERRRRAREARYGEVMPPEQYDAGLEEIEALRELEAKLESFAVAADQRERAALHLWLEGERRTEVLAQALALSHVTPHWQRVEVKRFKDRALKRFLRLGVATRDRRPALRRKSHG